MTAAAPVSPGRADIINSRSLELGCVYVVRYIDHVLFKDIDAARQLPWTREAIGWLEYEDEEYVRLIWERFAMPDYPSESRPRATGLVILKTAIRDMRRVG